VNTQHSKKNRKTLIPPRADLTGSICTLSPSRFRFPAILDFEFSTCDLPPGLQTIVASFPKDSRLIPILADLQSLASLPSIPTLHRDHTAFALLHRLLSLDLCKEPLLLGGTEEFCALTALLYLSQLQLKVLNLHDPAPTKVLLRLKSRLLLSSLTPRTRDFILWVTSVGALAARGTRERTWFVARMVRGVMECGISTWEEAKCMLGKFLWVEGIQEEWRRVWEEAFDLKGVLFG
jgi:hypothetical protein